MRIHMKLFCYFFVCIQKRKGVTFVMPAVAAKETGYRCQALKSVRKAESL